jgi:predicted secreted protein
MGVKRRLSYRLITLYLLTLLILIPKQVSSDFEYRGDYETGDGPHLACIADLDDDDDLDIVTADYNDDAISILINDGEGVFSKIRGYETGNGPRSIFLGDVDGDLDIDIVVANYLIDDTVSVFKNHGNATFASKVDYDVGEGPFSIFLADIGEDANGDLDLIMADDQSKAVSVMENDGTGSFSNRNSYTVGNKPKGVFLADLNDDGYSDIACVNWADATVSVLINKQDGTYKKHVEYITGDGPRAVSLNDLNGDDLPDIACANQHSNSVSVLMNNGDGTFSAKVDYSVGSNPLSIFTGDVDADSDCDILVTNLHDDTISVLENDGAGNFNIKRDYITDDGPYSIVFADVNDDNEVDLITANNIADSVSVHYSHFPSSIEIKQPDGANDVVNHSYLITWQDHYPYGEAVIDIFWDDDASGFDGIQIEDDLSEDDDGIGGRYDWNVTAMPEGDYWIYAMIDDGTYEPSYSYSAGPLTVNHSKITNTPPTFQIIEPNGEGDYADSEFTIIWMDSDSDDDAKISLYFDTNFGYNGILITEGLGEDADGSSGFYTWNTKNVTSGEYYIYGICDDGINEPVKRYSYFPVSINHSALRNDPPTIVIVEPDGVDDSARFEFLLTWIDADSDNDASISLFYDSDSQGYDGILIEDGISEDEHGNSGLHIWNISMVPEGDYFIYGIIDDGISTSRDYSQGKITINRNGTKNTAPKILVFTPEMGIQQVDFNFTIKWVDSDSDDDASISLYYDTDQNGYDGTLIASDISEDDIVDSFLWNTKGIPMGEYYIYAMIDDTVNSVVYDYSDGKLAVNHTGTEVQEDHEQEDEIQNNLLYIFLGVAFILILLGIFLKSRGKGDEEGDEEDKDFEDEEEDFDESEEEEVEKDFGVPEDELDKKEEQKEDEIEEDLLPLSENLEIE